MTEQDKQTLRQGLERLGVTYPPQAVEQLALYCTRLLEKNHIDFATFDFTDDERLLIEYGRAIARDPKHVPEDLMRLMQQTFTEEQLVVITTMGVFMIANNYFNDILNVDPAPVQE